LNGSNLDILFKKVIVNVGGYTPGTITFTENNDFVIFTDNSGIYIFNMTDFDNIRVVGWNLDYLLAMYNEKRAYNFLSNYN